MTAAVLIALAALLFAPLPQVQVPVRRIGATVAAALGAGGLALVVTGVAAVALVAAAVAAAVTWSAAQRARRSALHQQLDDWPDAIAIVRSAIRSGATLPEAMAEPAARGPESLRPRFREFRRELVASGSMDSALAHVDDSGRDPIGERVTTVVRLSADMGSADAGRVLDALAGFLRAERAQAREVRARQSWNLAAARMAVAAPWLTVAALSSREEARAAYQSPAGTVLLLAVAGLSAAAYWAMLRIAGTADPGSGVGR